MNGRPHEDPACRCAACVKYDHEQEYPYPYGFWSDDVDVTRYMRGCAAYEAERAAWQALVDMYDAVFADDVRDDSRDDT